MKLKIIVKNNIKLDSNKKKKNKFRNYKNKKKPKQTYRLSCPVI